MLDIKLIRENPEFVRKNLERRQDKGILESFDKLVEYDKKWRETIKQLNGVRKERNRVTIEITKLKKQGKDVTELTKKAKEIAVMIKQLEIKEQYYKKQVNDLLLRIPNILHETVPFGKDEHDNVVVKVWGEPPKFNFKPKGHLEILKDLGLIDTERAAKVAGKGFFYLKGELVLLDLAIMRFAIDFLIKKGYTLIEPPFMLRGEAYLGATDFEFFKDQLYKVENEDLYLIATAEHPIAAMFKDEVLLKDDLPLKFVGVSPCFRREVGAHGKYTKGLFRMHQFNKVEQFIFCKPEESWDLHEELQENSEKLYQKLGLHYRVVNVCTGDIGDFAAKKYDIEIWMADGKYRESGSNSNCTDYQARRLNIRYREKVGAPVKGFVHTLNNTALATSRTMIGIIEQFQQKDGTVKIPRVLWKYMDGIKKLERAKR
ncbi:MAG TPA: serine--tRNA ligase [Candidatus Aenigmarchaeota archaeon]|nr:serine--tRNA ligase [Candidatus Aenigmarchaeota archaeon]